MNLMNNTYIKSIFLAASMAFVMPAAFAQDEASAEATAEAKPAAPAKPKAAPAPKVSLEDAYRKEYAFLEAQKVQLQKRIGEVKASMAANRKKLEGQVSGLENRLLAARASSEAAAEQLQLAQEQATVNAENADMISSTFEQAGASLDALGNTMLGSEQFEALPETQKVSQMFAAGLSEIKKLSQVRQEKGTFYLNDGTEVSGDIVRYGNIAAYGVSGEHAGALVPAGGGLLRLWPQPAPETAKALVSGGMPENMQMFVYDNPNTAISDPEEKTFMKEVNNGGLIGKLIVLMGLIGIVLVVLRAFFLWNAKSAVQKIVDEAAGHVQAGRIDDAIAAAKKNKGSASRVVVSALRNLDRNREHLEDIVMESVMHESSRLSRFSVVIAVIAAVAPLAGLLGTVTGMIQTFDIITEFGTSDPKLLSGGIAVALVTTKLGLVVAIPMLLFGSMLNGWMESIKDDMEQAALKVINVYQDARNLRRAA